MDLDFDFERCKRLDNLEEAEAAAVAVASASQTASQILASVVVDFY